MKAALYSTTLLYAFLISVVTACDVPAAQQCIATASSFISSATAPGQLLIHCKDDTQAQAVSSELTNCTNAALTGCTELQANDTWLSYNVVLQNGFILFSTCPQVLCHESKKCLDRLESVSLTYNDCKNTDYMDDVICVQNLLLNCNWLEQPNMLSALDSAWSNINATCDNLLCGHTQDCLDQISPNLVISTFCSDISQGVQAAETCFNESVYYCNPPTAASYNTKLQDAKSKLPEVNTACVEVLCLPLLECFSSILPATNLNAICLDSEQPVYNDITKCVDREKVICQSARHRERAEDILLELQTHCIPEEQHFCSPIAKSAQIVANCKLNYMPYIVLQNLTNVKMDGTITNAYRDQLCSLLKKYQNCLDTGLKGCYIIMAKEEISLDLNATYIRDVCDYWPQTSLTTVDPSATNEPNSGTGSSTENPNGGPGGSQQVDVALIVGIVLACLIVLALIIAAILWFAWKTGRRQGKPGTHNYHTNVQYLPWYRRPFWRKFKRPERPRKLHATEHVIPQKVPPPYFVSSSGIPSNFVTKHLYPDIETRQHLEHKSLDHDRYKPRKWPQGRRDGLRPYSNPFYGTR